MPRYQKSAGFNKINADKIIATQSTADSMQVAGTTQSTSTTTGAITTNGGVGIVKDVFIGGDLDLSGSMNTTYTKQPYLIRRNNATQAYTNASSTIKMVFDLIPRLVQFLRIQTSQL